MTKYLVELPDGLDSLLEYHEDFQMSDKERARRNLRRTLMKLDGKYVPESDRPVTREQAMAHLRATLRQAPLHQVEQRQNSAMTLEEARRHLRQTLRSPSQRR